MTNLDSEANWKRNNNAGTYIKAECVATVRMTKELHQKAKAIAAKKGMSVNTFYSNAILDAVKYEESKDQVFGTPEEQITIGGIFTFRPPLGTEYMPGIPLPEEFSATVLEIKENDLLVKDFNGNGLQLKKEWIVPR